MIGQTITMLGFLYHQTQVVRIFFIDWESSQGRMPGRDGSTAKCPVSTWRHLFVANEFARLQTERLGRFEFTFFWVIVIMAQVVYVKLFAHRYVRHATSQ